MWESESGYDERWGEVMNGGGEDEVRAVGSESGRHRIDVLAGPVMGRWEVTLLWQWK